MRQVKKLNLSRETLHHLTEQGLRHAGGGVASNLPTCRVGSCTGCLVTSCVKVCPPT